MRISGLLLTLWATSTLNAAYLQLLGSANSVVTMNQDLNGATIADTLVDAKSTSSNSNPNRGHSSGFEARAAFGNLGLAFSGNAFCQDPACGTERAYGSVDVVRSIDTLTIVGATTGFLKLDILVEGTFGASGNAFSTFWYVLGFSHPSISYSEPISAAYGDYPGGTGSDLRVLPIITGNLSAQAPPAIGPNWEGLLSGSVFLPFTSGSISVVQTLAGQWDCRATIDAPCSTFADFYNSAKVGGAAVYDSNFNLVDGATLSSQSGFDYTTALDAGGSTAVPEPSTLALALAGLGFLAWRRRMC